MKERVRAAVDIVDVVGNGLELRRQGRNFVARCPWHNDRRPSMTVNPARQTWKCWVCDIGGDVFSFVMQRDGVDFPTAVRQLAESAGIPLEQYRSSKPTTAGQPDDKPTLLAALENVTAAYYDHLESGTDADCQIARDYLADRGIDDAMRKEFRIGFAPDQWTWATDRLIAAGFSTAVAVAAGLASPRRSGEGFVDMFRGRLMFPILDLQNRPISLGGRVIPAIARRHGDKVGGKYINGRETLLFKKSSTLYALSQARDVIRREKVALVMEGYTDVIAAHAAGIETAVAVLGTALTQQHVKLLRRFTERVVLVLDGDAAGRRRADEVLELFVGSDIDLRILTLPDASDPADFIAAKGSAALLDLAAASPDALDHKLTSLTADIDVERDTHAVASAADTMLKILATAADGLKIDQMLNRMASQLNFETPRLRSRMEQFAEKAKLALKFQTNRAAQLSASAAANMAGPAAAVRESASPVHRPVRAPQLMPIRGMDRELFVCLFQSPELAAMAVEAIDPNWLDTATAKMLLSAYQQLDLDGNELTVEALLVLVENEALKNQIVNIVEQFELRKFQNPTGKDAATEQADRRTQYNSILSRYGQRENSLQRTAQIQNLKNAELDPATELELLQSMFEQEKQKYRTEAKPP